MGLEDGGYQKVNNGTNKLRKCDDRKQAGIFWHNSSIKTHISTGLSSPLKKSENRSDMRFATSVITKTPSLVKRARLGSINHKLLQTSYVVGSIREAAATMSS